MRVAAVDLGTHSTRLLVADVVDGRLAEVHRDLVITRMGESVDASGALGAAALERVRDVLGRYGKAAVSLGAERTLLIATSAVRDARNGPAFLAEIAARTGLAPRLLSGEEEARLGFRGATLGRVFPERTLLVDIGGGSTELSIGGPDGVAWCESTQLGCLRLTERYLRADPPTAAEVDACATHVRRALPAVEPVAAVGVSGTVTTSAALDLGIEPYDRERVHGHRIPREAVERQVLRLASLPLRERARTRCLEPARAPVIVAGLLVLREILRAYRLPAIEASEHDILHGAALAAAETADR